MAVQQTLSGLTISSDSTPVLAHGDGTAARRGSDMAAQPDSIPVDTLLTDSLRAAGFVMVDTLQVGEPDPGRRAALTTSPVGIDVPVAPGESAALLVETADGLFSWKIGDDSTGERRALAGTVHFDLAIGQGAGATERRGMVSDWLLEQLIEPARVHVLRFLVPRTIDLAISRVEGDLLAGPVPILSADPATWKALGPGQPLPRPAVQGIEAAKPAKILLLVHGTFSTTVGSFGGLDKEMLERMIAAYDLVLGHDHRTLGLDPQDNAADILATLHALDLPEGSVIDAIAYSRGGLVLRALLEQQVPAAPLRARFDKAIFVGCTNGGTLLAEPRNWKALADIYTNVLVAGATIVGALSGANLGARIVSEVIKTLGRFVQMLPQVAITENRAPGLAAMEPGSPLVAALNGVAASPNPTAHYYAVTSQFEPGGEPGALSGAALLLIDGFADQLLGEANDLVVHTRSMTEFGPARRAEATFALGDDGHVYHTIYFASEKAMAPVGYWLGVEAGQQQRQQQQQQERRDPPAEYQRAEPPAPPGPDERDARIRNDWFREQAEYDRLRRDFDERQGPAGIQWDDGDASNGSGRRELIEESETALAEPSGIAVDAAEAMDALEAFAPPTPSAAPAPEAMPAAAAEAAPPPDEGSLPATTERHIAAEMPPFPPIETPANLYVIVSPQRIAVAAHAAAAATAEPVALARDRPLTVEVMPRLNCEIVGEAAWEADLHKDEEVAHRFQVRGLAPGNAEVVVLARQGAGTVASFTLAPVFVGSQVAPLREAQPLAAPTPAKGQTILRIYEFNMGNGGLRLQFNLTSDDPEFADLQTLVIDGGFSLDTYAVAVIKDVESAWNLAQTGDETEIYDSFLDRLEADAKQRTIALIPEPVRRYLWKNRKAIEEIRVISSEPHIPWELMYLSDPDGQEKDGQGFLAEWGLVRWLHDAPLRRRRTPLATGGKHFIIPSYSGANALAGAANEKTMLQTRYPDIAEIKASSRAVGKFLEDEAAGCALLHFACHGRTQQNSVISSELLMTEMQNAAGKTVHDPLTWQIVAATADFGPDGGPLVFVNACQTGQVGGGIAGAAGFANAFLRPQSRRGAAAFIGALWSVDDKLANRFAEAVYAGLETPGTTLPQAVKAAREVCKNKNDFTWLAYSVYASA